MTRSASATLAPGSLAEAAEHALSVVDRNIRTFGPTFPGDSTQDGRYTPRTLIPGLPVGSNHGWTAAFWTGQLWLAHALTGEQHYRELAAEHVSTFTDRMRRGVDVDTHDLGFLYTLSSVAAWQETGDTEARETAIAAAEQLMTRFLEPAGVLQAWGDLDDPEESGRTIIDSLMNTPLLFWASDQTGDPRYRQAAVRHTTALRDNILRADDSTFHTFHWDVATGEPLRGTTAQGYTDDSSWARGQAWGVYGFALAHRHTGEASFLDAAQRCADYFLAHLPADQVAYWDLGFTDGSGHPRDSSAAAIAVSGLMELASRLPAEAAERYRGASDRILASLIADYSTRGTDSDALLLHGVYHWHKRHGVDEGNLWGDYYYLEALTRHLRPGWTPWW